MHSSIHLPAISTVHAVLYRRGLVRNGGRPRYKAQGTPLSHAIHPNDLWCADYKGEFMLADKRYCYPLTITADEIVNGWNPSMTYSDSPRESAEPDFINSFLQTMPARAWLLRRSSEPVRCCSAKVDPAGFTIAPGIVRREVREGQQDRDRTGDGFDQPV